MLFIHFGYIETYDSYFYSVLTNSAQNTDHMSTIDPYTGQNNLQNYYKYEVSDIDIWKYLSLNKWRGSSDLTLSMMVNDIITLDIRRVYEQEKV